MLTYEVLPGDNLPNIAYRLFGSQFSVDRLIDYNLSLLNTYSFSQLQPGTILLYDPVLPVDETVETPATVGWLLYD
jgi:hypothetical protein